MTFFLGMNYKFSLYIFQLFPKSPPILVKFDLKHQITSIFTKIFPIYLQDFQIFPLSLFLERILINFPHFHQKWINFSLPPATTSLKICHPCFTQHCVVEPASYRPTRGNIENILRKSIRKHSKPRKKINMTI